MLNLVLGVSLDKPELGFYDREMSMVFVEKQCWRLAADWVAALPGSAALRLRCLAYVGFMPFPAAKRSLLHYLGGSGVSLEVNLAELLSQDEGVRRSLYAGIREDIAEGVSSGEVFIPQWQFSTLNWRFALGSLEFRWQIEAEGVRVTLEDWYRWDPDAPRVTRCLHQLAVQAEEVGARSFLHVGAPVLVSPEDVELSVRPQPVPVAGMYCM